MPPADTETTRKPAKGPATMLVRIKANTNGHPRTYTALGYGITFREDRGWYKVKAAQAEYLAGIRERRHDEKSPLLFDVCTEEQAKMLDDMEQRRRTRGRKAGPDSAIGPNDLVPEDLAAGTSRAKGGGRAMRAAAPTER